MHFWAAVDQIGPERLVFVDESGADTRLVRTHARALRGRRAHGRAPFGSYQRLTAVAGLGANGLTAARVQAGAMNTAGFLAYLDEVLIPALRASRPDAVVVLDNLKPHRVAAVGERLAAAGLGLLYLPPYSPDLAPVEQAWSKVKTHLRTAAARSSEALAEAFQQAISTVTPANAQNWFRHAGYAL